MQDADPYESPADHIECGASSLDSVPSGRGTVMEMALYYILRTGIAIAGLLWIAMTLSSHFLLPELLYDQAPGPPPVRVRLLGIILNIGLGVLLAVPHHWTRRAWLYWPRQVVYCALAVFLLWKTSQGALAYIGGGKSWQILPAAMTLGTIGLALPLCLLWSRRMRRMA